MSRKDLEAKDVLKKLAERAECYKYLGRNSNFDRKTQAEHNADAKEIGQLVLNSSPEERELLASLTPEDLADAKYPFYDYVHYVYNLATRKHEIDRSFRPSRKRSSCLILKS